MLNLIVQISKGFIRDARIRRTLMFHGMLAALLMLFCGSTFLDGLLREHTLGFLLFWAACAWLTFSVMLLALLDVLLVRASERREKRRLETETLRGLTPPPADDSHENPR